MTRPDEQATSEVADAKTRWVAVTCLVGAAVALGLSINVRDGEYWPSALQLLSISVFLCIVGTLRPLTRATAREVRFAPVVIGVLLVLQLAVFVTSPPSGWNPWSDDLRNATSAGRAIYATGGAAALVLGIACFIWRGNWWRWAAPLILLLHVAIGVWLIRATPSPKIDVFVFQQQGAAAFLEGRNPYAIGVDDIYGSEKAGERKVYGDDMVKDGKLAFGFPYPPLSLYLSTAGYAITGDHRYAQLVAMTLSGLFIILARPGAWATAMAAMLLFTPRGFFILGRGWTEPFVVLFIAATVFCALRARTLLPLALGLLLASKQYLVLAVPLVVLLADGPTRWRSSVVLLLKAGVVAAAVTLPVALWDWGAFWNSLVTVQKVSPFREDALSYLVWFFHKTGMKPGVIPAFVAAGMAIGLSLCRGIRGPAGFAAAVSLVFLLFISLNKQAFANYYYLVIGALWCAVAASDPRAAESLQRPETKPD